MADHPEATIAPTVCRRGRPPVGLSDERLKTVLTVAAQVFLNRGYGAATLDEIAARAHVSKTTIYRWFDDKADLFLRVVSNVSEDIPTSIADVLDAGLPVDETLRRVAEMRLRLLLGSPGEASTVLQLARLNIAEFARFPELGAAASKLWSRTVFAKLEAYFQKLKDESVLDIADANVATHLFLNSFLSVAGAMIDPSYRPPPERREMFIREGVRIFLTGSLKT